MPSDLSTRAAAGRDADDAIVDLEHTGAGVRDLLGLLPQAPAASRTGKRNPATVSKK